MTEEGEDDDIVFVDDDLVEDMDDFEYDEEVDS